jgi:hypothetical protein
MPGDRRQTAGKLAAEKMDIAVTNGGSCQTDFNLASPWRVNFDVFDYQRFTGLVTYRCFHHILLS